MIVNMPQICQVKSMANCIGRAIVCVALLLSAGGSAEAEPTHAIAMHGMPKHAATMTSWPYADPDAPKGGRLRLGVVGSFDSLNVFSFKGEKAEGIRGFVFESLLARSGDEPFSLYGLIAESIDMPDDRSSVTFKLRPIAQFSDGRPLTADDVIFSHALLRDRGTQNQRGFYAKVERTEKLGPHQVRFVFKPDAAGVYDRELPLIIGLMAILPKHKTDLVNFENTSLETPVGSGPYMVAKVDQGRSIVYRRNPAWWARDLSVGRGRFNFDEIHYEYFKDAASHFEAFKSGELDLMGDSDPVRWTTGYNFPALTEGRIVKREFESRLPAGMNALAFNTRRPVFSDPRIREALIYLFDFEWINQSLYGGAFKRTQGFFERSFLSSFGIPASEAELRLLEPFPGAVSKAVLDGSYRLPVGSGRGDDRANRKAALELLNASGFRLEGKRLVHAVTRKPLTFEILAQKRSEQRLLLTYLRSLESVGIEVSLRMVDSSQHSQRTKQGQFDMVWEFWPGTLSPGNEQVYRWGSRSADMPGTFNVVGVKSAAADAMIQALLSARAQEDLTAAARALDRILRSGHYVIPLFHLPKVWVAHAAHLRAPALTPNSGFDLDTWWSAR
jgi:peptide/nickel transport system substrate-binding protein